MSNKKEQVIIIGIDPGTRTTGYGVIRCVGNGYETLDFGCIRPPAKLDLNDRYLIIFEAIEELITRHNPHELAIETQYVQKNVQSALKIGMARAVVIVAARKRGITVHEYTPSTAKKALTGNGNASKYQVQGMAQRVLNLTSPPTPEDAADALCLAICHAQRKNNKF